MLPLPILDDRTYDEIVKEAIANITRHCPDWTDHNASDPGIALIELFAHMTESTQYRLNRVPEKNYLAFLDMLGIEQRYPSPARARVRFKVASGYEADSKLKHTITVPLKTRLSAKAEEGQITFETTRELKVSNIALESVFSKTFNISENRFVTLSHTPEYKEKIPFVPFEASERSNHSLKMHFCDPAFTILNDSASATLLFRVPTALREHHVSSTFLLQMEWEYYNGTTWKRLLTVPTESYENVDSTDADILSLDIKGSLGDFIDAKPEGFEENGFWIRAILREVPRWLEEFAVYEVGVSSRSRIEGILPDMMFYQTFGLNVDTSFYPFGQEPTLGPDAGEENFYLRSDEAFGSAGSVVSIKVRHSQSPKYEMPVPSTDLRIYWEYKSNDLWKSLGANDGTYGLARNGELQFVVPEDMETTYVNGEQGFWIRARIGAGNFGHKEEISTDPKTGQRKVVKHHTLKPPCLSGLMISYSTRRVDLSHCLTFNGATFRRVKLLKHAPVTLFESEKEKTDSLYLGFNSYLNEDRLDIYFEINDQGNAWRNLRENERMIEWEMYKGDEWIRLEKEDDTDHLTKSGEVRLQIPETNHTELFEEPENRGEGMLIRARIVFSTLHRIPKIKHILLNSVLVFQKKTVNNDFLGTGNGLPDLRLKLSWQNLIAPPKILCGNTEFRHASRLIDYSGEQNVFRFNAVTGEVQFGDGRFGSVPPVGSDIVAGEYAITEGKLGNVGPGRINIMNRAINFIEGVINDEMAVGGEDGDTLDSLKKHAPSFLKTRDRAVTVEDYEVIAREYSSAVIDARCLAEEGEIIVIIVTRDVLEEGFVNRKLIEDTEKHLRSKSLVTVLPTVRSPRVARIEAYVDVKLTRKQMNDFTRSYVQQRLNEEALKYFDPIEGGDEGDGYGIGRTVSRADLYRLLLGIDSHMFFDSIRFVKNGESVPGEHIRCDYDELIRFTHIEVEGFSYDF